MKLDLSNPQKSPYYNKWLVLLTHFSILITLAGCSSSIDDPVDPNPRITIFGEIVDSDTGIGIEKATVAVDSQYSLLANLGGEFQFQTPAGTFQLNACHDGYQYTCQELSLTTNNVDRIILNMKNICDDAAGFDIDNDGIPCEIDRLIDSDDDGVEDDLDVCVGSDDGIDKDGDSIPDCNDDFIDSDADGIADELDQCQGADDNIDDDSDGIPDCNFPDVDYDGDGLTKEQEDAIGTNPYERDSDFDTIDDLTELGVGGLSSPPADSDLDGLIDAIDIDSDNDGDPDSVELNEDFDSDGVVDRVDHNSSTGLSDQLENLFITDVEKSVSMRITTLQGTELCTCTMPSGGLAAKPLQIKISNLIEGAQATVNLTLGVDSASSFKSIQVLDSSFQWVEASADMDDDTRQVNFSLTDGGMDDLDSKANGEAVSIFFPQLEQVFESTGGGGGGGGLCFIATAAYGTNIAEDVLFLRAFRDQYLLTNTTGKNFVKHYYQYSPGIANFISRHEAAKWVVRLLIEILVFILKYPMQIAAATVFLTGFQVYRKRKFS